MRYKEVVRLEIPVRYVLIVEMLHGRHHLFDEPAGRGRLEEK
jgi:hypothetical protein